MPYILPKASGAFVAAGWEEGWGAPSGGGWHGQMYVMSGGRRLPRGVRELGKRFLDWLRATGFAMELPRGPHVAQEDATEKSRVSLLNNMPCYGNWHEEE